MEAKLILGEKVVLSLDTEFIENEKEGVPKQDCEMNAAKRLLERLIRTIKQSIKNKSSRLLESFRRHPITDEDVQYIQKHTSVYLECE